MEEWRNIEGYDDYQVSNLGRVKRLDVIDSLGHLRKERILKSGKDTKGYLRVSLWKNGKGKTFKVHRLVAQAFIDNPYNLPQVNHKDENPSNNRVENLEWCDAKYNLTYGSRIKRVSDKTINGKLSKTVYQYSLDGEFVAEYPSVSEAARQLDCDIGCICHCCNGKQKTSYGYVWRYKK